MDKTQLKQKMRIVSIINLKGGVGKTITSINAAYELSQNGCKVLVIDNDKQGNTSKFFGAHSYDSASLADVMENKADIKDVIKHTEFENVDIVPANMSLLQANKNVLLDTTTPQQTRIKAALESLNGLYDVVIIDNAPDVNMSVINALTASTEYIVPVKIDQFTMDGMDVMIDQAAQIKKYFNPGLKFAGVLVTNYRRNEVNKQGLEYLRAKLAASGEKIFNTVIRWTAKVDESTFAALPVIKVSSRCGAARDYKAFIAELLQSWQEEN